MHAKNWTEVQATISLLFVSTLPTYSSDDIGPPIRVLHSKYAGRKGWKHVGKGETESQIYLILQKVEKNGRVTLPEKVVRIAKEHYEPFERATTKERIVLEQKPNLQKKVGELVKELCKLNMAPNENILVLIGQQWLSMYTKKQARIAVDFNRPESPPHRDVDDADDSSNSGMQ